MRLKSRLILLLITAAILLLTCCAYAAGGNGSITVTLTDKRDNPLPEGKFAVAVYRIGEEDPTSATGWTMFEPFSALQVRDGMKADDLRVMAEKAGAIIEAQSITAAGYAEADLKTAISFANLETGIYMGRVTTQVNGLAIQPFIVALSSLKGQQTVNPKYTYTTNPAPKPTPTPTPPPENPDEHPYTLTIHYIYNTGETAFPDHVHVHWPGEEYDVWSPTLPGYYVTIPRVHGIMPARDIVYTVIYIPKGTTLIPFEDYDTPLGLGEIQMHVGVCYE